MSLHAAKTLLTSRRFMPLLGAQLLGGFNDQFLKNALIALVTWGGYSLWGLETARAIPLAGTLFTLPFFLFSSLAGQFADKYDKSTVLQTVKLAEILIMSVAALGLLIGNVGILLAALMAMGAQSAFFSPTRNAVLPQWLTDKELLTGNAIMSGLLYVFIMLGQIFGTLLVLRAFGPQIVAGVLVLFAILGYLSMKQSPKAPASSPDLKLDFNIVRDTINNLAFAFKNPPVLRPMLGTAWYYGLSAAVLIMMPSYVSTQLHYNEQVFLVLMVLFVFGAALGALLCSVLAKGKDGIGLSAIGSFGLAILCIDLYITGGDNGRTSMGGLSDFFAAPASKRLMFDLFGAAACASMFVVPMNTLAQRRADKQHRARLLAAGSILLNAATTSVQALVFLMTLSPLPMKTPFLIIGVVSSCIGLYVFSRSMKLSQEAQ